MKKWLTVGLLWCFLATGLWAQGVKVFLNNQVFKGRVAGTGSDISLEAKAVFQMLGRHIELAPDADTVRLEEGKNIPVSGGMIRAKDLVAVYGGKYDFNKGLNSVDVYAYDPIAAARKSLVNILKQSKVNSEADFLVLVTLTKQMLTQDLGLTLDNPEKVLLCSKADMLKVGAGSNVGCYVTYSAERKGSGSADYHFYVLKDRSAAHMLSDLAWSWGLTWANLRGLSKNKRLSIGFAYWTSHKVVTRLAGPVPDSRTVSHIQKSSHPEAADGYKELRELENNGGIEAVIKFIKDTGSKS